MKTRNLYFSSLLPQKHPEDFQRIEAALNEHAIEFQLLEGTKDIWARDYMPVQIGNGNLVQFRYEPTYLKTPLDKEHQTKPLEVLEANDFIKVDHFSGINLDGGNVVRYKDKAILTDRVVKENPWIPKKELVEQLSNLLEVKIILIPDLGYDDDLTGHADGLVRFIDDSNVLINAFDDKDDPVWKDDFLAALKDAELTPHFMPWFHSPSPKHSAIGIYINYLELDEVVLFPIFKKEKHRELEEEALSIIEKHFIGKKTILPVHIKTIGRQGGLLNCVSWTTF
jgi:agmatine deiminase